MTIRFGEFEFDGDARQVRRGGEAIHLEPKAFGLLAILLSRRPAVVPKQELHERLWPNTFVTDANLSAVVSHLRQALGDDVQDGLIRTVHGFGYSFGGDALDDSAATADLGPRVQWQGVTFALGQGENILGRVEEGAVFVEDASVSRRHARIVVEGEKATIEDLDSRNGTWLHSKRLSEPAPLEDGDSFRLGSALLVFHLAPSPDPAQPVADSALDEA